MTNLRDGTRPCYICGVSVTLSEGWHLDGRQWCENHEPVWGNLRRTCEALHPDSDKGYAPVRCQRRLGHGGDHCATTKGPSDQWWKPRTGDVPEVSVPLMAAEAEKASVTGLRPTRQETGYDGWYVEALEAALRKCVENAEAWHGPPPDMGHVRALVVIARTAREALDG